MATGNDGITPAPPDVPAPVQGDGQPTKLPLWSFIFGLASFIQCLPLIGGVLALVFGFMGRKRAKQSDQGTGLATAGIILGILGLVMNVIFTIVLIASGFAIFGTLSNQTTVAQELTKAQVASQAFYAANNSSYSGLTIEQLREYGYTSGDNVQIRSVVSTDGSKLCVEGALANSPTDVIHIPPTPGETTITISVNGTSYQYATGPCPV